MPAPALPRERLTFLDVARGAAALLVVLEHGLYLSMPGYLEAARAFVVIGEAGILVFFLISGFVIPMTLENGGSVAGFWLRRAFRLFPVYWFSIGLAFATAWLGGPNRIVVGLSDTKTWLANLTLLQGFLNQPHVWGVFWTLQYELVIYAVFSLLFACGWLNRVGGRVSLALIAGFALLGVGRVLFLGQSAGIGLRMAVVACPLFGWLARRYTTGRLRRGTFYGLVTGLFAAVVLTWAVSHARFPSDTTPLQLGRFACLWGPAFVVFLGLLEARHRRMPRAACWLGERSYPIYLLHPFVIVMIPKGWPAWAFVPCLVASTLLLAALVHRLVEVPGIAWGRRLEKRLRRTAPPAPVELRRAA
jgi:peptidoglycan/LPS O-acetylase OafA/YrhL